MRAPPYAPYVLAQTVLVQQHALEAASQRIAELEAQAAAPRRRRSRKPASSASRPQPFRRRLGAAAAAAGRRASL